MPCSACRVAGGKAEEDQQEGEATTSRTVSHAPRLRSPEATRGEVRVQVKTLDMPEDLVEVAVSLAVESLSRHGSHNHRKVAQHIKEYFDACLSPAWQCVVGQHFGSFITHSHGTFCHFFVDDVAILLFRTIPAALAGCKRRETP